MEETAELAAQGQESAPGQIHLHKWHFTTLLEINGPENSQMLSAVLITASSIWILAYIEVWGFKRTASSPRASYITTRLPFQCISARYTKEYCVSESGILPEQPGQQAWLSMSFPWGQEQRAPPWVHPAAFSVLGCAGAPLQQAHMQCFLQKHKQAVAVGTEW